MSDANFMIDPNITQEDVSADRNEIAYFLSIPKDQLTDAQKFRINEISIRYGFPTLNFKADDEILKPQAVHDAEILHSQSPELTVEPKRVHFAPPSPQPEKKINCTRKRFTRTF